MSLRPWEQNALIAPIGAAAPLYDRTVAIHRLKTIAAETPSIGLTGYSGAEQTTGSLEGEAVLFTGLPATIQAKGGQSKGPLPADVVARPQWIIQIPASSISIYSIRDRDIAIDDEGYRYAVSANYWSVLGYHLITIRLEA